MRYYEAMYIVHPNQEDAGLTKVVEATKKALAKRGGELMFEENMGKKRLAYAVEKQRFGTYVLLQFQGEGVDIASFGQDLELNDDVIAQIIVAIDPDEIRTSPPPPEEREGAAASDAKSDAKTEPAAESAKDDKGAAEPAEKAPESAADKDEAVDEDEAVDQPDAEAAEEKEGDDVAAAESGSDEVAEVDAKADSQI